MMVSRRNIFAPAFVAEISSAATILVLNSVTGVLAAVVEKPSLMRLIVTVDERCCNLHCPVVLNHRLAGMIVRDRRAAVIHKSSTTVMETKNLARSVLS